MKKTEPRTPEQFQREIVSIFRSFGYKYCLLDVFSDFLRVVATCINNSIPAFYSREREDAYMRTVHKYKSDEFEKFAQILAYLKVSLELEPADILGQVFHILELHNKWKGQFFTPFPIAYFMASSMLVDVQGIIKEKGYFTISEPTCGSGVMIIAAAKVLSDSGVSPHLMLAECRDIDPRCVHMTYIQMSLLGIPAVVIQGNSLTEQQFSTWYTPAYAIATGQISKAKPENSAERRNAA